MKKDNPTKISFAKLWQHFLDFLSHPAWNGVSCFFAAISALGLGSMGIISILGLFNHIQDFLGWFLSPVEIPVYLLVIGIGITLSLIFTIAHRNFFRRGQQSEKKSTLSSTKGQSESFEPSDLDVKIMKQLATSKEDSSYWVDVSLIAKMHDLTKAHADYYLRKLENKGFVKQHMISGDWGINDVGTDYLINHDHI